MLRITLAINAETIADYEVRNVSPNQNPAYYEVRRIVDGRTGRVLLEITHDRKRGAEVLARKVLDALAAPRSVETADLLAGLDADQQEHAPHRRRPGHGGRTMTAPTTAELEKLLADHVSTPVHQYDFVNGVFVYGEDDELVTLHQLCQACTSDRTLELLGDCEWTEDTEGSVYWPCDVHDLAAEVLRLRADAAPAVCNMTHTPPFDFAQCETHDTTFALGEKCKYDGRDPFDVIWEEAHEQRVRAVRAEVQHDEAERARVLTARQAWEDGYRACREGQQRHNPFRLAGDPR